MIRTLLMLSAFVLTLAGVGLGVRHAFAEGDGCVTYVQQAPPGFICYPDECNNSQQTCTLATSPTGQQCACNGVWQYPFCQIDWYMDPHAGFTVSCVPVLCPADCIVTVKSPGVFYCKCQ